MKKKILLLLLFFPLSALACFMSNPARATITPNPSAAVAEVIYMPSPTGTHEPACTVTAENLNVRSQPEGQAESSVLTWLYSGDIVTILETRGAWVQIRAGNVTGWINSKYCEGK